MIIAHRLAGVVDDDPVQRTVPADLHLDLVPTPWLPGRQQLAELIGAALAGQLRQRLPVRLADQVAAADELPVLLVGILVDQVGPAR